MFFFQPEPYVRRVIFLTTAHRGGKLARQPGVRLGVELIRRNNPLRPAWAELEATNGPEVFQPFYQNRRTQQRRRHGSRKTPAHGHRLPSRSHPQSPITRSSPTSAARHLSRR